MIFLYSNFTTISDACRLPFIDFCDKKKRPLTLQSEAFIVRIYRSAYFTTPT